MARDFSTFNWQDISNEFNIFIGEDWTISYSYNEDIDMFLIANLVRKSEPIFPDEFPAMVIELKQAIMFILRKVLYIVIITLKKNIFRLIFTKKQVLNYFKN